MEQITDNVFVETLFQGCNSSFIVTKQGAVVIDTPMVPAEAREWKLEIEKHAPVKYVIINEAHADHYCGSCYLDGTVIGSENTVSALKNAKIEEFTGMLSMMSPESPEPDASFYFKPPEIVIEGEAKLLLGDHTINILAAPGHTPQQLAVHVPEERILFTSDNINLEMPIFINADPDQWIKTLDSLSELDVDHVIPGHGEVTDKSAFPVMKNMIKIWLDVVGEAIEEGLDLDGVRRRVSENREFPEIPEEEPMAGFFNMNLEALYKLLSA
jgi:glyoxylase-like metal-dependent hydrolase (beta-lactamase superfamily II)